MKCRHSLFLVLSLISHAALCQTAARVPAETPLPVQIDKKLPMHVGQPIRAELIYPIYVHNKLVLPEKTVLDGTVTDLRPNRSLRNSARLRGDFTPFRVPVVRFTDIVLADGKTVPITTGTATAGAPIYRLVAPPPRKGGFLHQQFDKGMQMLRDQIAFFTAPGKRDRFSELLYSQLPWHPQNIQKGTAWTVETAAPFDIPPQTVSTPASVDKSTRRADPSIWIVKAYLDKELSSTSSKAGDPVRAVVAEPIYNPDHTIAVPQGSTLVGAVTQAMPARRFGRAGILRFNFRQIVLPSGRAQNVQAALTAADSSVAQNLAMTSEGQVKPKPQDRIVVPLLLAALAATPLHQEPDDGSLKLLGKRSVASNSVGVAGFIAGTASGSANVAAGFGAYGAALSIYNRWIKHGREVTFAKDTRIVVQTTPRRAEVLEPASR